MPTKVYVQGGNVFDVSDDYDVVMQKLNAAQERPFVFEAQITDEERRVTIVNEYIVAVEETNF